MSEQKTELQITAEKRAARLGFTTIDELLEHDKKMLREWTDKSTKSGVVIKDREHNLVALLDLLRSHRIKVCSVVAFDLREGEAKVKRAFVPSMTTKLICEAPWTDVLRVIQGSEEFRSIASVVSL